MNIITSRHFDKKFDKLDAKIKQQFKKRIILFIENSFHPILNNHQLSGEKNGFRSINLSGDLRIIYEPISKYEIRFIDIGSHSELY